MKTIHWIVIAVGLAGVLAVAGCGKKQTAPPEQQGTKLDLPKLQEAFSKATPEAQTLVTQVLGGVRYGQHAQALAALDKLANTPGITDAQKAIVTQVTEQVKQVMSKAAGAPPQ
jgi:hypothetical protein